MSTFSRQDALQFGWAAMKRNLPVFSKLLLMSFVLAILQSALRSGPGGSPGNGSWLTSILLPLVSVAVTMAWIKAALLLNDGLQVEMAALVPPLDLYLTYLLASVLYGLMVTAGMILLVVPGVLWAIRYAFFGFLIIDKKLEPVQALKRSAQLTAGVRGPLMVFGLMLLGINILGALALGIGLCATVPTSAMAAAYVYRRLLRRAEEAPPAITPPLINQHPATA